MNIYRFPYELPAEALAMTLDMKETLVDPPMSDAIRTLVMSYGRWELTFAVKQLDRSQGAIYKAYLMKMRSYLSRCKIPDMSRLVPRGSWAATAAELVQDPLFQLAGAGWTFTTAGASSRVTQTKKLKLVTDGVHVPFASTPLVTVANTAYVLRVYGELLDLASLTAGIGTTATGFEVATAAALAADGYVELPFNSGANVALFATVKGVIGTAGQSAEATMVSVHRALLCNGLQTVGSNVLKLKGGPLTAQDVLLAGDAIEIGGDWYEVDTSFDTDGAGNGAVLVTPCLRQAFADGTSVITQQPTMTAVYRSKLSHSVEPGIFRSFTTNDVVEDLNT